MSNNLEIENGFDEHLKKAPWISGKDNIYNLFQSFKAGTEWVLEQQEKAKAKPWSVSPRRCPECERHEWRKGTKLSFNGEVYSCPQAVCNFKDEKPPRTPIHLVE